MERKNEFLATAPVGKLLVRLAIPTISAQLINMLYNVVDRMFIGRIPGVGDLTLTGVGVCMPLIFIISAFASLMQIERDEIFAEQQEKNHCECAQEQRTD